MDSQSMNYHWSLVFQVVFPHSYLFIYRVSQRKFTHLAGSEIKNTRLIFKTEILIYQSMAHLDEKNVLGTISHHLDL